MGLKLFAIAATALGLLSALLWPVERAGADATAFRIDRTDPSLVALGRTVYADSCASCHGAKLQGEPNWRQRKPTGRMPAPPHDATGHTWHHADALLYAITKFGLSRVAGRPIESDMPAFEDLLSDREIIASLTYIKSTWPADIQARHDALNARAQ